jgi:HK97 family phage major capsid protein
MKLPTIEELTDQLEVARQKMEASNAAITNVGPDADPDTVADIEAKFDEEEENVERLKSAIDRHVRMDNAYKDVPRVKDGETSTGRITSVTEPLTYRPEAEGGKASFFQDVWAAKSGNPTAQARLARHQKEMAIRNDMTTSATDGGEFVPPQHIQEKWAELARAGRVYANVIGSLPIPTTGMSFTVPRVTSGVTTAVHTENNNVSETDAVTDEITLTVRTIAGQVDLSRQSFERSDPGLDLVLGRDLARSYAVTLDAHLLNHANDGVLNNGDTNGVTYTDASPTVGELYPKIADAVQQVHTGVFMSPDAIFMHPRRWATFIGAVDTTGRPLVNPVAPQNPIAGFGGVVSEGAVGSVQGLPVFVDANIPTTGGAGTDEDAIIATWLGAHIFYESVTPRVRVFEEVGSGTLTVRIQVYGYIAYSSKRYDAGTSIITGTGLVAPSF